MPWVGVRGAATYVSFQSPLKESQVRFCTCGYSPSFILFGGVYLLKRMGICYFNININNELLKP